MGSSGGGGGGDNFPSAEESVLRQAQADLIREQRAVVTSGIDLKNLLDPRLFEAAGLDVTDLGPNTKLIKQLEAQFAQEEKLFGPVTTQRIIDDPRVIAPNADRIRRLAKQIAKLKKQKRFRFKKKKDPFGEQREEIRDLAEERVRLGLEGKLPVAPRLLRDLERQERDTEEGLRRQFGRDFRTSSPAQETIQSVNERKSSIIDAARRGDLTFAEQIGLAEEAQAQARTEGFLRRSSAIPLSNQAFSSALANVSQGFNAPLAQLRQDRLANISQPTSGKIGAGKGAIGGAAIGLAFGPVGAVVGAGVGALVGAFV